jgi:phage terminase small subunit
MANELTQKQEAFAQKMAELSFDSKDATANASDAYRFCYSTGKMKPETIHREAYALLQNPKVAARIDELKARHLKRHDISVDRVLAEYAKLAFLDIRKALDDNGHLKPISELDDDTAAAIAGLEVESLYEGRGENREHVGTLKKIKLSDKKGALDSIARHLGMFTDKAEISGPNGGPIETKHSGAVTADLQSKSLDELTRLFTEKMKG